MAIIALSDDARKNIKMGRKKKTSECPVLFGLPWAETAARKWINAGGLNKCCCFFPWKENVRGWAIQKKEKCVCHETRSGFPRWNATLSLLIGRGWRCFTPVTAAASSSNFRAGRTAILFWNGVVASHRLLVFWKEKKKTTPPSPWAWCRDVTRRTPFTTIDPVARTIYVVLQMACTDVKRPKAFGKNISAAARGHGWMRRTLA